MGSTTEGRTGSKTTGSRKRMSTRRELESKVFES